jgi:hypothetical protein
MEPLRADPVLISTVLAKPYDIEQLRAAVES